MRVSGAALPHLIAALLLAGMGAQMMLAIPHASAVVDEPAHLTSGYLVLAERDLTVNREHPPLVKVLAALPLLFLHPALPPVPTGAPSRATEDFEFLYSREFLYRANDADSLLRAARVPVVGLALLAGLVVYLWGRALAGMSRMPGAPGQVVSPAVVAPLVGLALVAFEPNMLAHGRLVTTDMGAALFILAAYACLERSLAADQRRARVWAVASGVALGLALLSRFSSLLIVPLMAVTLLIDRRCELATRAARLGITLACAALLVNLAYGFSGAVFPLAHSPIAAPLRSEPLAALEAHPVLRWTPVPLPRLYVEGLDLARYKNRRVEGPGFLNGEYSEDGWWSYFVQALSMKMTLPSLILSALGLALIGVPRRGDRLARHRLLAYLVIPALGMLFLVSLLTRAQIGVRYVLPVIPFLCLAGGYAGAGALDGWRRPGTAHAAARLSGLRRRRLLAVVLLGSGLVWHARSALAIHPYHLAYFNEAAGGARNGHRHLVDSNLDWGQDLIGLKRFMERTGLDRINLYYFGTADPDYYDIRRAVPPEPGYFAVSATHLMGVYLPDKRYLASFREMTPETTIGHSIRIYRLSQVPDFLKTPIRRP